MNIMRCFRRHHTGKPLHQGEMLGDTQLLPEGPYICKLLVAEGKISRKNAKKLNHIICTLFLGYFKFVQSTASNRMIPELENQFIQESKEIHSAMPMIFTLKLVNIHKNMTKFINKLTKSRFWDKKSNKKYQQ